MDMLLPKDGSQGQRPRPLYLMLHQVQVATPWLNVHSSFYVPARQYSCLPVPVVDEFLDPA
jgi:hypothetical protein